MAKSKNKPHFRKMFQEEFGAPDICVSADEATIEKYKGVLPNELLMYWKEDGWCGYKQGIFWLVNPDDYADDLQNYLQDTPFEDRKDLYVIARTAFGELYVWERGKGNTLDIDPLAGLIMLNADSERQTLSQEDEEFEMNRFIGTNDPEMVDYEDANDKPLFERALKKFGSLKPNEMYGYKLSLELGGQESIRNLDKVDLSIYFDIARQLQTPTISISDVENNTLS